MRILSSLGLLVLLLCPSALKAQFVYGTTGLLHMPTGDMQYDKTFMFGCAFLDTEATPGHWGYDTGNYFINITFFPWLEVGYTCTLHKALYGSTYYPEFVWGKYCNQDRQFSVRLRLWKEGWWKEWTPQIVLGANDPSTGDKTPEKDYGYGMTGSVGNGHWQRYYLAVTKHLSINNIGELGIHLAYVYNKRIDYHLKGPAIGINFRFQLTDNQSFLIKAVNKLNLMAEYDNRTINIGTEYSFWKDYINAVIEFNSCRYFSGGLVFKVHLK